jgi:hypothetical protein
MISDRFRFKFSVAREARPAFPNFRPKFTDEEVPFPRG